MAQPFNMQMTMVAFDEKSPFELLEDVAPRHTVPRVCEHTIACGTEVLKRHLHESIIGEELGYALHLPLRVELLALTCWHPRLELLFKDKAVKHTSAILIVPTCIIRAHVANEFAIRAQHVPIRLHGVDGNGIVLIEEEDLASVLVAQRSI